MAKLSIDETELSSWLHGRAFDDWRADFDRDGYVIFENILPHQQVAVIRDALKPHLEKGVTGRNDFEGVNTNRVYALLAKSPVFADLATHPLALAFAEADLGSDCLLSACLAINLHPEESAQPWHYDDGHIVLPRPRSSFGVSAFWAIDDMTEANGATEILPGSHLWPDDELAGALQPTDFVNTAVRDTDNDPGAHPGAIKVTLSSGSLMLAKGTLWHRGGANKSGAPRLIITPQYCPGWARQLENQLLAVPPDIAAGLPERARELIGYSIHSPFMGYVDGVHPRKVLER